MKTCIFSFQEAYIKCTIKSKQKYFILDIPVGLMVIVLVVMVVLVIAMVVVLVVMVVVLAVVVADSVVNVCYGNINCFDTMLLLLSSHIL